MDNIYVCTDTSQQTPNGPMEKRDGLNVQCFPSSALSPIFDQQLVGFRFLLVRRSTMAYCVLTAGFAIYLGFI